MICNAYVDMPNFNDRSKHQRCYKASLRTWSFNANEEDVAAPPGVVGGLEVQNNRNQIFDVLDSSSLAVQMNDGCGVGGERVIAAVLRVVVVEGVRAETVPECSGLLFQSVGLRALLLEGVSDGTNAILSGGSGLEEISLCLKLLAAVGVGGVQGGGLLFQLLGGGESFITKLDRGGGAGG